MNDATIEHRVIGLDVHPDTFTAAALTGLDAVKARIQWVTDDRSMTELETWAMVHTTANDTLVLEASGNSFETAERLGRVGRKALVLESLRAGQIKNTYCTTDKLSAIKIARVYLSGLAVLVWTPDETTRARRDIFHRYRRAVTDSTRCRNRIKSFLSDHGVRLPKGTRLTQSSGEKIILSARPWTAIQQQLLRLRLTDLIQAEAQRKELSRLIAREVVQDKNLFRLIRLFGVRHIVAFALAAFIGDIHRFRSPKQLVAYIGLNPRVQLSGQGGYVGSIAHQGRRELRALLAEAAHAILHHANPLHAWGWKLAFRKGKNCAVIAVARKLTVACWYLMQGMFTPLLEVTSSLKLKISKIVTIIGRQAIRELGYKTSKEYEQCLHLQLMNT
jgi:transposase